MYIPPPYSQIEFLAGEIRIVKGTIQGHRVRPLINLSDKSYILKKNYSRWLVIFSL
jgi:hypothetical protein